jgi:hypothetical protein
MFMFTIYLNIGLAATIDGNSPRKSFIQIICENYQITQIYISKDCGKTDVRPCTVQAAFSKAPARPYGFSPQPTANSDTFSFDGSCSGVDLKTDSSRKLSLPNGCTVSLSLNPNRVASSEIGSDKVTAASSVQCDCEKLTCKAHETASSGQNDLSPSEPSATREGR